MEVFSYKGIDKEGREVKGVIEAPNLSAAYKALKKKGIYPYQIEEEKKRERSKSLRLPLFLRGKGPSPQELITFLRTLSTLLKAGIPITEAVESFGESEEAKHLKVFFKKVSSKLLEGAPLSEALKEAGVKDPIVLALVKSGERSGLLAENLKAAADILSRREELKGIIFQAFLYPTILTVVAASVVVFMMTTVIPKVITIYKTANLSLPKSTKVVITFSKILSEDYQILLLTLAGAGAALYGLKRKKRELFDRMKLKIPLVGRMVLAVELQRFFETLGKLLNAGLPLIESIEIASETVKNSYLRSKLQEVKEGVEKGRPFFAELSKLKNCPKVVLQLVKAGEQSGELGEMSLRGANYLKSEIEFKVKGLTLILEPATMLILGIIIGFIIYALLLPIVSISTLRPV
ncbi:type II secretion system F family protein [Thermovibrio sp.]